MVVRLPGCAPYRNYVKYIVPFALAVVVLWSATTIVQAMEVEQLSCPAHVDITYSDAVPVRRIAAEIVEQWGLEAGPLDALPEDEARTFFWVSNAQSALTVLARNADWTWYRDGDTVRFAKRDDPLIETTRLAGSLFKLKADRTDGGLIVTVDSDLADSQEIEVSIYRVYFKRGSTDAYSGNYIEQCGLAAQWRVPKLILIDDDVWKADLIAYQDLMALLGEDTAFDIEEISDYIEIKARSRFNNAELSVLLPLTVSISPESSLVGADNLVLWESYELLAETPLIARISSSSERGGRLNAGEIIRVEGIEYSQLARWYLVTVNGRQGWINSIALLQKGVIRVSTLSDSERKAAELHQSLMDNVFGPCIEFAYHKLVGGQTTGEHSMRLAMFESIQPALKTVVSDLMEMELDLLSESEIRKFYRDSLNNCKAGVG